MLVVKCGSTEPSVAAVDGDYEAWFERTFRPEGVAPRVVSAHLGEPLPDPADHAGVVVMGSPLSVRDEAAWMSMVGRWSVEAAERGVPVLAVCFGLQLAGEALGGRVGPNPAGREIGTVDVDLTDAGAADPLFSGLPRTLRVQATHGDVLIAPPTAPGVVRLAGNDNTEWQAFAWGEALRAVQFHPELAAATLARLLAARGQQADVEPTEHGRRILVNWVDHWIR